MGPTSFFTRHEELFPYHLGTDGEIIREVPKVMVALVATAVCHNFFIMIVI